MMKYAFSLLVLCFVALSCQQDGGPLSGGELGSTTQSSESLAFEEQIEMEPPRSAQPPAPPYALDKGSKIIRSGNMEFEVEEVRSAKSSVDELVSSLGAYYEKESYRENYSTLYYDLRIRVAGTKFDSLVGRLEQGVGQLKVKNISANDVTEEYVDLKIRLDNKLAVLAQYKAILKKATTIEEILTVNEKIRNIEEEI